MQEGHDGGLSPHSPDGSSTCADVLMPGYCHYILIELNILAKPPKLTGQN